MKRYNTLRLTPQEWIGGWGYNNGSQAPIDGFPGQVTNLNYISFRRLNKINHLAPGELLTGITDSGSRVNELPLNAVVCSNAEAFAVLRNARLVRFGIGDEVIDNNYDITLSGGHSGHTAVGTTDYSDIINVTDLATTPGEYVLWSWQDGNDADIALISSTGGSQDDDWFSTRTGSGVLTRNVPHMFAHGPQGIIGVTNGQYIATITITGDITTVGGATINRTKLNLGAGWVASSITYSNNYFHIVGYRATTALSSFARSQSRLWVWNGRSDNAEYIHDIPDNYTSSVFNDEGVIRIWTTGRNNTTKCFKYTGGEFGEPEFEYDTGTIGAAPKHGSVDNYQNMLHMGFNSANYAIGTYDRGAFNIRIHPNDSTASVQGVGMVKDLSSNGLFVGVKTGASAWKIMRIDASKYYPSAIARTRLYRLPARATINNIRVFFSQFTTGSSMTMNLYRAFDAGTTDLLDGLTISRSGLGADVSMFAQGVNISDIEAFWLKFTFDHSGASDSAAIIAQVEIDYEWEDQISS